MKILVAPQAFKGSFGSREAAEFIARGVRAAVPAARVTCLPIADGGDGLLDALLPSDGRRDVVSVRDPLGRLVEATIGWCDSDTAVIESAMACGLTLLKPDERDPLHTSTEGVGDLMLVARDRGAKTIVVGLGGSATVDGGTGMGRTLGWRFLGIDGMTLPPGGGALVDIDRIEPGAPLGIDVVGLCDVHTPMIGGDGAASIFAPQKGAGKQEVMRLSRGLDRLAQHLGAAGYAGIGTVAGGGAAGGVGAGLVCFAGGRLVSGIDWVLDRLDFDTRLAESDAVITGEGVFDASSLRGKGTGVVLARAEAANVTAAVIAARIDAAAGVRTFSGSGRWLDPAALTAVGSDCARSLLGLSGP